MEDCGADRVVRGHLRWQSNDRVKRAILVPGTDCDLGWAIRTTAMVGLKC